MNFSLMPLLKYALQQLTISIVSTLIQNFFIKRTKNFDELKRKIDNYNKELDKYKCQLCPSEQQQHIDYITKELEKTSASISGTSMRAKLLTFVVGFVLNRILGSNFKGVVILKSPFAIPSLIKKIVQKNLKNPSDYDLSLTAVGFLFN